MSPTNFQPTPVTPPATASTSLFPSLGPLGSIITSAVVAAAAAGAGWLASKGYIQGADQTSVSALIVAIIMTIGGIVYKAITARMAAKVVAVQAADPKVVVAAVNAADPAVLIKAVNAADNGVKVVPANSPTPAVNVPLK